MTTNNNYSLSGDALNKIKNSIVARRLCFYESVTSTFDVLSEISDNDGTLVVAAMQTNGRGRLGRSWDSDKGGIYFSFSLPPNDTESPAFVTLVCALAVQKALSKYLKCQIKWPNDIVSSGKKLCGILTKSTFSGDRLKNILVGIGINANNCVFPKELVNAASLKLLTGTEIDENLLLTEVIKELDLYCFNKKHDDILKEYKENCVNIGQSVTIHYTDGRGDIKGKCTDVLSDGTMNVVLNDGKLVNVSSGEVSVKGIYEFERTM